MQNLTFLFIAFAAIWSGLFLFLLRVARQLTVLQRDVEMLKQDVQN